MGNYLYYESGEEPSPRMKHQKYLMTEQIKKSKIKLRSPPLVTNGTIFRKRYGRNYNIRQKFKIKNSE